MTLQSAKDYADNAVSGDTIHVKKSEAVWTIDESEDAIIVDDNFMTWMFQA